MFSHNLHQLNIGKKYPNQVNCIIEIPKGKNTKYEYNEELGAFKLTRCLISSLNYPINYGFIPQTIAQDGDPLDVLVHNHDSLDIGTIAECRVIGVLDFIDEGGVDNKILAVPKHAPVEKYSKLSVNEVKFNINKQVALVDFFKNKNGRIYWLKNKEVIKLVKDAGYEVTYIKRLDNSKPNRYNKP
jgi:inorganic pyrophosphatase